MPIPLPENLRPEDTRIAIGFFAAAAVFFAGRASVSAPDKSEICKVEIGKLKKRDIEVGQLERDILGLKASLKKCEDSCDDRLRDQTDRFETECATRVANDLKKQKERFTNFKCKQCKRQGHCK